MSRASGLSLKALRLYDANGLLVPARVDPATGYRSYGPEQLERARSIALLRRLELPLRAVAEVLDAPASEQRARLLGWREAEREGFARRSQLVDVLVDTVGERRAPTVYGDERVRIVRMPARKLATITRRVAQHELVTSLVADTLTIRAHLEAHGGAGADEHRVVFHDPVGHDLPGRIETGVPYEGTVDPADGIALRLEPERDWAVVEVSAAELHYPELLGAYEAVRRVAGARGGMAGPPLERYAVPWSEDPDTIVAWIAAPIAEPGAEPDDRPGVEPGGAPDPGA